MLLLARCPAQALEESLAPHQLPPLHMAAEQGQVDCLVLLLQRCASVEGLDSWGRTALMVALEAGRVECTSVLLEHTGDLDAVCGAGVPLLHKAAQQGMATCVAQLLGRGASIDTVDFHGRTALHAACLHGQACIAVTLLEAAAGRSTPLGMAAFLDRRDVDGCTPALLATRLAYHQPGQLPGLLQCVSLCLQRGADTQAASKADGRTMLFFLAAVGATDLVGQMLILCRADPNRPCVRGLTALHFAAAHGQADTVRLLLAHGAQPDMCDDSGATPIDHALRGVPGGCAPGKGHADCHSLLLRRLVR